MVSSIESPEKRQFWEKKKLTFVMSNVRLVDAARLLEIGGKQVLELVRTRGHRTENPNQTEDEHKAHAPRAQPQHDGGRVVLLILGVHKATFTFFEIEKATDNYRDKCTKFETLKIFLFSLKIVDFKDFILGFNFYIFKMLIIIKNRMATCTKRDFSFNLMGGVEKLWFTVFPQGLKYSNN